MNVVKNNTLLGHSLALPQDATEDDTSLCRGDLQRVLVNYSCQMIVMLFQTLMVAFMLWKLCGAMV